MYLNNIKDLIIEKNAFQNTYLNVFQTQELAKNLFRLKFSDLNLQNNSLRFIENSFVEIAGNKGTII